MINKYLIDMKCDFKLKLEGYKQLRSGELREKITPYIYKDGEVCEHGEFSKGVRARIDAATLATFQTLINDTSKQGGLDLLMPDEIFEGLDSLGLQLLLEAFNRIGKTTQLTTHVTNESIYPHILMVEKINGISKIKN
jgi:DNA repair exonuclease SbcCD ATPase subunit